SVRRVDTGFRPEDRLGDSYRLVGVAAIRTGQTGRVFPIVGHRRLARGNVLRRAMGWLRNDPGQLRQGHSWEGRVGVDDPESLITPQPAGSAFGASGPGSRCSSS